MSALLARAFADEWGRIVAALVRSTGDWTLAEECTQEAFAAAVTAWADGEPDRPGAWLMTVARNRATDRLRRRATEARVLETIATDEEAPAMPEPDEVPDERLRLIFTCCHPALPLEARVALTLRTLCGLTVDEIAAAFGVAPATMQKRLVRARAKIQRAHIPYRVPSGALLPERLGGVLAVLLLLFTEGYAPTAGAAVVRADLSGEAIRLTRALDALLPGRQEVLALLALELFQDSRRTARTAADGSLVPLSEQDPAGWDRDRIAEARRLLDAAEALPGPAGALLLQARIAAEHARGPEADLVRVVAAYDALLRIEPSPFAALARAVAVGRAAGPAAGLAALDGLSDAPELARGATLPAARADLLQRLGDRPAAADAYRAALAAVTSDAERRHLERRLAEVRR